MKKFYVLDDSTVAPPPEYLDLDLDPVVEAENAEDAIRIVRMRRESAIKMLKQPAVKVLKQSAVKIIKRPRKIVKLDKGKHITVDG